VNLRADTRTRGSRRSGLDADLTARRENRHRFTEEEWLTPIQIARKLGYATDKPVRSAIKRGELKASHAPCRRKLIVAESEVLRWIDDDLAYEPMIAASEPSPSAVPPVNGHRRRRQMPTLNYAPTKGEHR
jgi:hypothetical protein